MAASLGETFSRLTRNVQEKTQNFTEKGSLMQELRLKERQQTQLFTELGRMFFLSREANAHEAEEGAEFAAEIAALSEMKAEIEETREKIALLSGACICAVCGASVPAESRFCPSCGHAMSRPEPEKAAEPDVGQPVCPSCGQVLRPGTLFCTACGTKLDQE